MPNGWIQATPKFRDFDGRIRLVAKYGLSRAAAERALKVALAERQTPGGAGAVVASTHVTDLPAVAGGPTRLVDRDGPDVRVRRQESGRSGTR